MQTEADSASDPVSERGIEYHIAEDENNNNGYDTPINSEVIEKAADSIDSLTYEQSRSAESASDASTTNNSISVLYAFVMRLIEYFFKTVSKPSLIEGRRYAEGLMNSKRQITHIIKKYRLKAKNGINN